MEHARARQRHDNGEIDERVRSALLREIDERLVPPVRCEAASGLRDVYAHGSRMHLPANIGTDVWESDVPAQGIAEPVIRRNHHKTNGQAMTPRYLLISAGLATVAWAFGWICRGMV